MKRWRVVWMLAALLIVQAAASSKAMIIFDASGSMWGKVEGKSKITIAKEALGDLIRGWNDDIEVGLTVYGHRRKGDCNDIETLIPIGRVDKSAMLKRVASIMPKGKTPIAKSLKQVASALRDVEDETTIILISDGKESCDPDPCAVAASLKEQGINVVAHVIGFHVDKATDKQLGCIAQATGGRYFSADNAAALNQAMESITKQVAAPKPKPVVKRNVLEVTVSETEGGAPVDAKCYVTDANKTRQRYMGVSKDKAATKWLALGDYTLRCTRGSLHKEIPVTIRADEKTAVHLVMGETGEVAITASETPKSASIEVSCSIFKGHWGIRTNKHKAVVRRLGEGNYTLTCSYNQIKKSMPFTIKAGETTNVHMVMGSSGTVKVVASEQETNQQVVAVCSVQDANKTHRWNIITKRNRAAQKQLPAGQYTLRCQYVRQIKAMPLEIKAGESVEVHVAMPPTGEAEVSVSEMQGGKWINAQCWAYSGNRSNGWFIDPKPSKAGVKRLPAGQYTLECRYHKLKRTIPLVVKPGETTKVHMVMERFRIEPTCDDERSFVKYEVYATNGRLAHQTTRRCALPLQLTLENGSYRVEVSHNDQRKTVTITIGDEGGSMPLDLRVPDSDLDKSRL